MTRSEAGANESIAMNIAISQQSLNLRPKGDMQLNLTV